MDQTVQYRYQIGDSVLFRKAAWLIVAKLAPNALRLDEHMLVTVPVQGWRASPALTIENQAYPSAGEWLQAYRDLKPQGVALIALKKEQPEVLGETNVGLSIDVKQGLSEAFAIGQRQRNYEGAMIRPIDGQILTLIHGKPDVLISFVNGVLRVYKLPTVSQLLAQMRHQQRCREGILNPHMGLT